MTTLVDTPDAGLEDIQRAAFFVFFEKYNTVLGEVQAYWNTRDDIFNTRTGRNLPPTILEAIPNDNFHEGHKPSLIRGGPNDYPNLAVFAMRADPSSESNLLDQMDSWSDSLLIEIMVKATDEDTVNRRIQRATQTALICLRHNQTLGGAVTGLESTPALVISDVFALKSPAGDGGYGQRYVWQGSAIQCRIRKDSILPPPTGSIFAGAAQTDYSQFIDQG